MNLANSQFEGLLNENDKILRQIWDAILSDPQVIDAFHAGNNYDILIQIVREKFDEKVALEIEKYYNFAEVLEREQAFSVTLIRRFVDALAERTAKASNFVYDEERLKEALCNAHDAEISVFYNTEEVVDMLFHTLNTASIPQLDGVDGLVKTALNNAYVNDTIGLLDKRTYFNSLVAKYEAYLKKLYYLLYQEDVPRNPNTPTKEPALAECIFAFKCLRWLKNTTDANRFAFQQYLEMLRQWRNDEAHIAPNATEQEVNMAIKVVGAMYLYVVANSMRELESKDTAELTNDVPFASVVTYTDAENIVDYHKAAESSDNN